jgi:hypothetical protein
MNFGLRHWTTLLLLIWLSYDTNAQRFPVSATIQVLPPYTPYLSDYVSPGQDHIRITLINLDLKEPSIPVKLKIHIEGQGYSFTSGKNVATIPITLQANTPLTLTNEDLRPYITPGTSLIQSLKTNNNNPSKLSEGAYQFCVEVYHYIRDETPISDMACTVAFLQELDPPIIIAPSFDVIPGNPQAMMIAWHTQHFGGFPVDYELSMYEKIPGMGDQAIVDFTAPVFRQTTPGLAYMYRADDPPLVIGKTYLVRVQVRDALGRNLFKNHGYSTIAHFQYGRSCDPPLITEAKLYPDGHAHISWTTESNHGNQEIRYRYHDDPNWTVSSVTSALQHLSTSAFHQYAIPITKPSGPLQVQIGASCYNTIAVESAIASIKLDRKSLPRGFYSCGMDSGALDSASTTLITDLNNDDTISANGYLVIIKSANKSGDTYSGQCGVMIPMFKGAIIKGHFSDIKVNEDYVMIAGNIRLESAGVQLLSDKYLDLLDGLIETAKTAHDILSQATFQSAIEYLRPYLGMFLNDSLKDQLQQAIDNLDHASTPDEQRKAQEQLTEVLKDITDAIKLLYDAPYQINFFADKNQRYGFDKFDPSRYRDLVNNYDKLSIAKKEYYVPFKSLEVSKGDLLLAKPEVESTDQILFILEDSTEVPATKLTDGNYQLTLPPFPSKGEYNLYTVIKDANPTDSTHDEHIAGQCKIVVYEPQKNNVILIPINGAKVPDATSIQDQLNKIYAPAVSQWNVTTQENLDVPSFDNTLDSISTGLLSTYTAEMRTIIKAYIAKYQDDTNSYHLFIVNGSADQGLLGFMPKKRAYGFTTNTDATTIAHELGHGAFRLNHLFEDYTGLRSRTDNLMDYNTPQGSELLHYQWEEVHHPAPMVGWLQGDDEGELVGKLEESEVGEFCRFGGNSPIYRWNKSRYLIAFKDLIVSSSDNNSFTITTNGISKQYLCTGSVDRTTGLLVPKNLYPAEYLKGLKFELNAQTNIKTFKGIDPTLAFDIKKFQIIVFKQDYFYDYLDALCHRKDIDLDKALKIAQLLDQIDKDLYDKFKSYFSKTGSPCDYSNVFVENNDFSKCWQPTIDNLEAFIKNIGDKNADLIAAIKSNPIDKKLVDSLFGTLTDFNYSKFSVNDRQVILSYLIATDGAEKNMLATLKFTSADQIPDLFNYLQSTPWNPNDPALKYSNTKSTLLKSIVDEVHDGILNGVVGANNYTSLMTILRDLLLKSPDLTSRINNLLARPPNQQFIQISHNEKEILKLDHATLNDAEIEVQLGYWHRELDVLPNGTEASVFKYTVDASPIKYQPFDLVVVKCDLSLSLVEESLESKSGSVTYAPAIMLAYIDEKTQNDLRESAAISSLDLLTIASGGSAMFKIASETKNIGATIQDANFALRALEVGNSFGNLIARNIPDSMMNGAFGTLLHYSDLLVGAYGAPELLNAGIKTVPGALKSVSNLTKTAVKPIIPKFIQAFLEVENKLNSLSSKDYVGELIQLKNRLVEEWKLKYGEDLVASNRALTTLIKSLPPSIIEIHNRLIKGGVQFKIDGNVIKYITKNGEEFSRIEGDAFIITKSKGSIPNPNEYLNDLYITNHLEEFKKEGAGFIVVKSWIEDSKFNGFPPRKFVGLKSEMDRVIETYKLSKNNWKVLVDQLNLGTTTNLAFEDIYYIRIDGKDSRFSFEFPNGNENGAIIGEWIPGGFTKNGVAESVLIGSENIKHNKDINQLINQFPGNWEIIKDINNITNIDELNIWSVKNGINYISPSELESICSFVTNNYEFAKKILLSTKDIILENNLADLSSTLKLNIVPKTQSLTLYETRVWYCWRKANISDLLDKTSSLESQARQAFDLRNKIRSMARAAMKDTDIAIFLDSQEANMTWDQVFVKYEGDFNKIIEASMKGRPMIDLIFKIPNIK